MFHLYFCIVLMFNFCVRFFISLQHRPLRPAQSAREAETQLYLCGHLEYSDAADHNPCILSHARPWELTCQYIEQPSGYFK